MAKKFKCEFCPKTFESEIKRKAHQSWHFREDVKNFDRAPKKRGRPPKKKAGRPKKGGEAELPMAIRITGKRKGKSHDEEGIVVPIRIRIIVEVVKE